MAGLLDYITEAAKSQYAKGAPYRNALGGLLSGDMSALQDLNKPSPVMPNEALDVAMTFAPMGITAWHGSPYQFNKFDISKIGTGEKAQEYGHGLYLADIPEVAKQYKKNIVPEINILDKEGKAILSTSVQSANAMHQLMRYRDIQKAKANTYDKDILNELINLEKRGATVTGGGAGDGGSLYKVDIPDKAIPKMLDWDKPLSEQTNYVQKAWINAIPFALEKNPKIADILTESLNHPKGFSGQGLYNSLSGITKDKKAASEKLKELGITGIRYIDSSNAGKGSFNYVIFDDTLPKILERNGIPLNKIK